MRILGISGPNSALSGLYHEVQAVDGGTVSALAHQSLKNTEVISFNQTHEESPIRMLLQSQAYASQGLSL